MNVPNGSSDRATTPSITAAAKRDKAPFVEESGIRELDAPFPPRHDGKRLGLIDYKRTITYGHKIPLSFKSSNLNRNYVELEIVQSF